LVNFVEDGVFQLLESVDDPDIAMVVASPWIFFPEYEPELTDLDQTGLGLQNADDAVVFCAVSGAEDGTLAMNLLGPFVVNKHTNQGRQVVLMDGHHQTRTPMPAPVG
jgi:flagellar assembly factor FliW